MAMQASLTFAIKWMTFLSLTSPMTLWIYLKIVFKSAMILQLEILWIILSGVGMQVIISSQTWKMSLIICIIQTHNMGTDQWSTAFFATFLRKVMASGDFPFTKPQSISAATQLARLHDTFNIHAYWKFSTYDTSRNWDWQVRPN